MYVRNTMNHSIKIYSLSGHTFIALLLCIIKFDRCIHASLDLTLFKMNRIIHTWLTHCTYQEI